jgi:hypothetical protein
LDVRFVQYFGFCKLFTQGFTDGNSLFYWQFIGLSLLQFLQEHAKLSCSAGKRDWQVFLPFAVSNGKLSGRDLVLDHRCRYACTPPHPKKRIQRPLQRPQVVSDDRFDTTEPTGASTKKHGAYPLQAGLMINIALQTVRFFC